MKRSRWNLLRLICAVAVCSMLAALFSSCAGSPDDFEPGSGTVESGVSPAVDDSSTPDGSSPSESEPESVSGFESGSESEVKADADISISFGGDILIHTGVFTTAKTGDGTYDFKQFLKYGMEGFFDADWNVCNMENPIDVNGDNSKISTYPAFNAPREVIDLALGLGIDTVTFCNNHIYDKKYSGFVTTVNHLREKIDMTGAYLSEEEYNTPYIRDVNGVKVGMLCYADHVNGYTPEKLTPYSVRTFKISLDSVPPMAEDIKALKEAGAQLVVVYLHWGREYQNAPSGTQKKVAHALCDAGADVIMGMHSHCVQPIERYTSEDEEGNSRECVIMYSLGNLFADQTGLQTNSKYGPSYAKTQYAMKVTLNFHKDGETGKVTVNGGEYTPTYLFRKKLGEDKYAYRYVESGLYQKEGSGKNVFDSESDRKKCVTAFTHVTDIVGDVFPVKNYE